MIATMHPSKLLLCDTYACMVHMHTTLLGADAVLNYA